MRKIMDDIYRSMHPAGIFRSEEDLFTESLFQGSVEDTSKFSGNISKVEDTQVSLKSNIDAAFNRLNRKYKDKDGIILACLIVIQSIERHLAMPITYFVYALSTKEIEPLSIECFFCDASKEEIELYKAVYDQLCREYADIISNVSSEGKDTLEDVAKF